MPGFWTKTKDGHEAHINGDPRMPEATAQALAAVLDAAAKQLEKKPSIYQRIGETLVAVDELKKVLSILIDDYTVAKLEHDGSLISPDLISFKAWVDAEYPSP